MTVVAAGVSIFAGGKQASAAETYTVVSGDTLSSISEHFFGDASGIDKIAEINHIENINLIHAGQSLTIPAKGENAVAGTQTAPSNTAQSGQPAETAQTAAPSSSVSSSDAQAKEWIAMKESGGSYTATNGQYYGRYQLTSSYLNGDYSPANQEAVADAYVAGRYGSWTAAMNFWQANGWY